MERRTTGHDEMISMLALDSNDAIMQCFQKGTNAKWISSYRELDDYDPSIPLAFRGMTQRKTVAACESQGRDFYYIDTGYIGNLQKRKVYHRVVKNGMQHSNVVWDLPNIRYEKIKLRNPYVEFKSWKKFGSNILLVTPSEKPCKYYGIDRDTWVKETIDTLKKHTDRKIIIRDKALRKDRVGGGNIYSQFVDDDVYAVVTYQSIAAIEALGFGIPAFTLAPTAADALCLNDLSKIESPLYEDESKVKAWQNWLAFCQYEAGEMIRGDVMSIIRDKGLW